MLEKTILLIGIGTNKFKLNEINEVQDKNYIKNNYGESSCFLKAYNIMQKFSQEHVYILNIDAWENVKDQEEILADLCFDYIVPLDLFLDDAYYDEFYNKKLFYSQLLLLILHKTISTVIMTGKKASGYETLSAYLDDEFKKIEQAQIRFNNLKRENFIYVTNNLIAYDYANVVLACMLIDADYAAYPSSAILGDAYFEIDYSDIENKKLAFFKNNSLTGTTIENLVNFSDDDIRRLVPVNKIIKYFYFNKPDHDQFIGKAMTDYRKVKIREILEEYLNNLTNWIIYKYKINSVTDLTDQTGAVTVILRFDIWPKFTTEKYRLETKL